MNAPDTPGIYKLEAEYVPKELAPGTEGSQIRVIAGPYQAPPVEIIVRR